MDIGGEITIEHQIISLLDEQLHPIEKPRSFHSNLYDYFLEIIHSFKLICCIFKRFNINITFEFTKIGDFNIKCDSADIDINKIKKIIIDKLQVNQTTLYLTFVSLFTNDLYLMKDTIIRKELPLCVTKKTN